MFETVCRHSGKNRGHMKRPIKLKGVVYLMCAFRIYRASGYDIHWNQDVMYGFKIQPAFSDYGAYIFLFIIEMFHNFPPHRILFTVYKKFVIPTTIKMDDKKHMSPKKNSLTFKIWYAFYAPNNNKQYACSGKPQRSHCRIQTTPPGSAKRYKPQSRWRRLLARRDPFYLTP